MKFFLKINCNFLDFKEKFDINKKYFWLFDVCKVKEFFKIIILKYLLD